MSLIIDALKKAQELRLKEPKGAPILKYPHSNKRGGRGSKKQWFLFSAGFITLGILLLILLKPTSPPLTLQAQQTSFPLEMGRSTPVAEKILQETPKEVLSLSEESLPPFQGEKKSSETKPTLHEKREEALIKKAFEEEKSDSRKKLAPEKSFPPQASQKEEVPPKSIGVEQEGGKDHTLSSEILNHFNSGVHFSNQREFAKAIQAYQRVIELDPSYVEAYNNLGIIYQMLGDVDRAFGLYQKSTEINPRYEKGYNNLGTLLLLRDRYEEAQEAFQKALMINANHIQSHIHLGILFKKKGQWEKAIESYQKALSIDSLHRETHYNIALLYEQLGRLELAISHYQQFIQLSSKTHPDLVSKVQRHLNDLTKKRKNKSNIQ